MLAASLRVDSYNPMFGIVIQPLPESIAAVGRFGLPGRFHRRLDSLNSLASNATSPPAPVPALHPRALQHHAYGPCGAHGANSSPGRRHERTIFSVPRSPQPVFADLPLARSL